MSPDLCPLWLPQVSMCLSLYLKVHTHPQRFAQNWGSVQSGASFPLPSENASQAISCPSLLVCLHTSVLWSSSDSLYAFLFPSSCRISTQPAFLWFCMMSILSFSCSFEIVRGSSLGVYLCHHLGFSPFTLGILIDSYRPVVRKLQFTSHMRLASCSLLLCWLMSFANHWVRGLITKNNNSLQLLESRV